MRARSFSEAYLNTTGLFGAAIISLVENSRMPTPCLESSRTRRRTLDALAGSRTFSEYVHGEIYRW